MTGSSTRRGIRDFAARSAEVPMGAGTKGPRGRGRNLVEGARAHFFFDDFLPFFFAVFLLVFFFVIFFMAMCERSPPFLHVNSRHQTKGCRVERCTRREGRARIARTPSNRPWVT